MELQLYLSKHIPSNVTYKSINELTKSYILNKNITYRLVKHYAI